MKKIISLLLSLTMLLSIVSVVDFSAYADTLTTGKCGKNVTYSFDAETGVLTISGEGDMENYNYENNPFYKKSNIKTVIIKNGVTSIGDWVFYNCSSLTSITIPNSVTSIGNWVFRDCTSLTSVAIPTSVTSIGDGVFYCCESLTSIEVSNNNENYSSTDGVLFNKNKSELITYPAGKTDSEYAIPNSVTSIGSYAFFDCESLTSVTIPNSVTNIGVYAFYGCKSLTSVTIPDSVISIGDYAFSYCESLTSVTIPNSVTSICSDAFFDCTSLKSIEVSDNNKNYSSVDGVLFNKDKTELIKYPSSKTDNTYEIPDNVTSIGAYAFQDCSRLTSVTIPNSVTSIGYGAFLGCSSLTSVTIPNSVTSIGSYAFYDCTNLANVYYSGSQSDWNKITIGDYNECLTNAALHCSSTPTPTPEPTPTPNPAPQPTTQSTQETQQQVAKQTVQQQSTQNDTAAEQVNVAKPKSTNIKKIKAAKKAVSVEWKKVSGVKGYQIQVATDKKFKKNKKTVTVKKQKTTKTTVKKLKAKKKYYVRIRTYKIVNGKKVYSSWSKVKSVKTK